MAAARATMPTTSSGGGGAAVFAGNTNRDDAIKTTGPKYTIKGMSTPIRKSLTVVVDMSLLVKSNM